MEWLFLLVSLAGAGLTYNAYRPTYAPARGAFISFVVGCPTIELALHAIVLQSVVALGFIWAGTLQTWPGLVALGIALVSSAVLGYGYWRGLGTEAIVEHALQKHLGTHYRQGILRESAATFEPGWKWHQIVSPFPIRPQEVERIRNIIFARAGSRNLQLDVYRHRSHPANRPTLLQIHGGAWVFGSKNEQGRLLMHHLAAHHWVCVSASYRLSPRATFPDHLLDVKRAIRWIREHGEDYGCDPDFLVVTGGSAGGHLAALVALTANDPEYQPAFEPIDTSVQCCVPFYGVYDFTDRHGVWPHPGLQQLLERQVMKVSIDDAPEAWERASPIARISSAAPPFFVIHGDLDSVVPVAAARRFCEALHRNARIPPVYAELPGAQHAFELFPSPRSYAVVRGVECFLSYQYSQYLRQRRRLSADCQEEVTNDVSAAPQTVPARRRSRASA